VLSDEGIDCGALGFQTQAALALADGGSRRPGDGPRFRS
jgi:hypothetical protein